MVGACLQCGMKDIDVAYLDDERQGFSYSVLVKCNCCDWQHIFHTSHELTLPGKDNRGRKSCDVNIRTVMAFREIGRGHEAIKNFTSIMNMPPPLSAMSYSNINSILHEAYKQGADASMKKAAKEIKKAVNPSSCDNDVIDCQIGIDGSWQKRGHASLNGIVAAVSRLTKKVLDYHVMSKFCRSCAIWVKRQGTKQYENWKANHQCDLNHVHSSGAMESAGALSIFNSSLEKYNLRYSHYIGDGDTEAFKKVCDAKPYGDSLIPVKLEYVGHFQKRLGTRLRKLRNMLKGKLLSDGKKISGKGRLTDKIINKMQNYFGMAIRQNKGRLYSIKSQS